MLKICLLSLLVLTAAFADQKSHEAAVKKFFEVGHMEENMSKSIAAMLDVQIKSNPRLATYRATLMKFFNKYMDWKSLEPEFTKIYMKEFTEDEMKELIKFYQTPFGQKVMQKLPALMSQGATIGQQRVQAHSIELQQMILDEQKKQQGKGK